MVHLNAFGFDLSDEAARVTAPLSDLLASHPIWQSDSPISAITFPDLVTMQSNSSFTS